MARSLTFEFVIRSCGEGRGVASDVITEKGRKEGRRWSREGEKGKE